MATWLNPSKNSAVATNPTKSTVSTFSAPKKDVFPWQYNQSGFTYNQVIDSETNRLVYYNSINLVTYNNVAKS